MFIQNSQDEKFDKLMKAKQSILKELKEEFSMQKLTLLNEDDPNYERKETSMKKI